MDNSNLSNVLKHARNESDRNKVRLFLELVPEIENKDVPDPWFGDEDGFFTVYEMLDRACDQFLLQEIKK
jgi:protein-tyrosine phosphatase